LGDEMHENFPFSEIDNVDIDGPNPFSGRAFRGESMPIAKRAEKRVVWGVIL
jgi:hypothetical protein